MKKRKSPVEELQCPSCGDGIGSVWQTTGKVCEGGHGQGSPARASFGCKGAAEGMRFFPGMEILMGSAKRGLAVFISSFPQNGFFTSVKEVCEREKTKTFERE